MRAVKDKVRDLVQMLNRRSKEAKNVVDTMHKLQVYLEEKPKSIIHESLDRLLSMITSEVTKRNYWGSAVVLVSPEGWVTVVDTYNINSDSRLERLKSQGFLIMRLDEFSSFIDSLKSEVAKGNFLPVIEFLRANTKIGSAQMYSPAIPPRESPPRDPSSSQWKLSDFLPARFPHPPLPRGLFKD